MLKSLNPCFNGRYSQRRNRKPQTNLKNVLILVLMEDTLRAGTLNYWEDSCIGLNPCFNGRYSQRFHPNSLTSDSRPAS